MNLLAENLPNYTIGDGLPFGRFELHSRFERVVNFTNPNNQLIFLTSIAEAISTNGIVIQNIDLSTVDSITVEEENIKLNHREISKNIFSIYDSSFEYPGVVPSDFETSLYHLLSDYPELFPEKSMAFLLNPEREKFFPSGFDFYFMKNAKEATTAILKGDISGGVRKLKGTGTGLTPAGDDFIAGMIFGLHYIERIYRRDLSALRAQMYETSLGTNLLVNTSLFHANLGKYFGTFKNLLSLLVRNLRYHDALKALLSYGATSGADLLSGYIFTIKHKIAK